MQSVLYTLETHLPNFFQIGLKWDIGAIHIRFEVHCALNVNLAWKQLRQIWYSIGSDIDISPIYLFFYLLHS